MADRPIDIATATESGETHRMEGDLTRPTGLTSSEDEHQLSAWSRHAAQREGAVSAVVLRVQRDTSAQTIERSTRCDFGPARTRRARAHRK